MMRKKGMAGSMTHQHIHPSIVSTHEQKIMKSSRKDERTKSIYKPKRTNINEQESTHRIEKQNQMQL
jgi:hypothetical protein